MWMRLVPLLPILHLHRLGAVQHFSRAYGGAPSFAERPDTITYAELTTTDWTTDPPPSARRFTRPTCTCHHRLTLRLPMKPSACSCQTCQPTTTTGSVTHVLAAMSSVVSQHLERCVWHSIIIFLPRRTLEHTSRFDMPMADVNESLLRRLASRQSPARISCASRYAAPRQL